MSGPSGQPSPTLRAVGVGLVAVALVLGAVGILTENQDSPSASADQTPTTSATGSAAPSSSAGTASPAPSSSTGASTAPSSTAPSSAAPSSPATVSAPAPASPLPSAGSTAGTGGTGSTGTVDGGGTGGGATGGSDVDRSVPVRVLNNSTTTGLAADAASRLQQDGFTDVSTGNYPQGVIPTTTVYYRPGTAEEPAAQQIAATLGTRAEARFAGLASASPGVILIVTSDFRG